MNKSLRYGLVTAARGGLGVFLALLLGGVSELPTSGPNTTRFRSEQPASTASTVGTPAEGRASGTRVERAAEDTNGVRLLPNLEIFAPTDLHVVGSRASGDLRLKFGTTIWNTGAGPLETRGAKNPKTGALEVYQFFHTAGDRVTRGPRIGTFNYSHRHGHLHLEAFARYELWSLDETGRPRELVALNSKVGFCLMDIKPVAVNLRNAAQGPVYSGCRAGVQGISVGYGDEYVAQLFEQDLDISGLPDGIYTLVTTTNPGATLVETDYADNVASIQVRLRGGAVDILPLTASKDPAEARKPQRSVQSSKLQAALTKGSAW